ncbi:hypothetical protein [Paenibacillus massiliensis]|uniref:hypothetical protein n=1 Tax=Paenibacillus massiliensis TaxID=225917 RepID=UPI0003673AFB|nr:hypothetical protein [Paenibacillus massiliensis]
MLQSRGGSWRESDFKESAKELSSDYLQQMTDSMFLLLEECRVKQDELMKLTSVLQNHSKFLVYELERRQLIK